MNKLDQRIAIGESLDWDHIETLEGIPYGLPPTGKRDCPLPMPDYPNDLNAMHEAEQIIRQRDLWSAYVSFLKDVCGEPVTESYSRHTHIGATAPQRAEAFLKTLGLWKESK